MQLDRNVFFPVDRALWLGMSFLLCGLSAMAQQTKPDPREAVFSVVEQSPQPVGGFQALSTYLAMNLRYPDSAAKARVTGKVYIRFIVEPDGQLTDVHVLKSIGLGCDEEAVRVVKAMPRWNPGRQSGRAVRVWFNLPIVFELP
ncbi:MAG: energy transducer TonB [Bacteroidetes bacterium]|nr:energy transducer TonB [Fibrella sp.]